MFPWFISDGHVSDSELILVHVENVLSFGIAYLNIAIGIT